MAMSNTYHLRETTLTTPRTAAPTEATNPASHLTLRAYAHQRSDVGRTYVADMGGSGLTGLDIGRMMSATDSPLVEGGHGRRILDYRTRSEVARLFGRSPNELFRHDAAHMSLSCCICGSVSAWELWWVASEGEECEGDEGFGAACPPEARSLRTPIQTQPNAHGLDVAGLRERIGGFLN